jgi:hypothetical protein
MRPWPTLSVVCLQGLIKTTAPGTFPSAARSLSTHGTHGKTTDEACIRCQALPNPSICFRESGLLQAEGPPERSITGPLKTTTGAPERQILRITEPFRKPNPPQT